MYFGIYDNYRNKVYDKNSANDGKDKILVLYVRWYIRNPRKATKIKGVSLKNR